MSQKPLVYVSRITNLSDARYCAGMGVDVLGFQIDPASADFVSPKQYQEMIGWISGPRRAVEIPSGIIVNKQQLTDDYKPDLVHLTYETLLINEDLGFPVIVEMTWQEWIAHGEKLNRLGVDLEYIVLSDVPASAAAEELRLDPHAVLLAADKDDDTVALLHRTGAAGLVLQGTREDAPGLKDYDHLSRILEAWGGWE